MKLLSFCLALLLLLAAAVPAPAFAQTAPRSITTDIGDIGRIEVLAPEGEPNAFIIFISDRDGLTPQFRAQALQLVGKGAAVALVDEPEVVRLQAASDDVDCHYLFGDFEDLSLGAQRQLNMATWRQPLLVGVGEGGALAYYAMAQAPDNTTIGAVSDGFSPQFESKLQWCEGAPKKAAVGQLFTYSPMPELPGRWTWITSEQPKGDLAAFATANALTTVKVVPDPADRFNAVVEAAYAIIGTPSEPLAGLPLVELPATNGKPTAMVVFFSGDGGWRDIDKQIGDYLSARGVAVIGVDSLRYFWSKKDPKQIAADVDRIVAHYQRKWHPERIGLLGFSFGADVLPLAWGKLSRDTQKAVNLIALLGLSSTADLQISVEGWLGLSSGEGIAPYLAGLPAQKVMCFFGTDEKADKETGCILPELGKATLIERPGGHHFDGVYQPVAESILARLGEEG
ncbi:MULTISPECIES: virulence factor family protein [Rhodomicrobium]|uniref:virulence factor family protein n=1 Tax=Rhodomicrobium TaxID=1068 RepID=UPI001481FCC0|nr:MULTISPECIES: virulence factor family protein [Rhodomicrobium]